MQVAHCSGSKDSILCIPSVCIGSHHTSTRYGEYYAALGEQHHPLHHLRWLGGSQILNLFKYTFHSVALLERHKRLRIQAQAHVIMGTCHTSQGQDTSEPCQARICPSRCWAGNHEAWTPSCLHAGFVAAACAWATRHRIHDIISIYSPRTVPDDHSARSGCVFPSFSSYLYSLSL